jgi:hypothetical protein
VSLVGDLTTLEESLPAGWGEARIRIVLEQRSDQEGVAGLLAPLQPFVSPDGNVSFRIARDGTGPTPEMARRALSRVDAHRLHGRLEVIGTTTQEVPSPERVVTLAEQWAGELDTLPGDWSDLYAELEFDSSDYIEPAALNLSPINPRREPGRVALRFRGARRQGYGASPEMVRRCLARCDEDAIRGRVRILRALSDTDLVGTQGPVWLLEGRTV